MIRPEVLLQGGGLSLDHWLRGGAGCPREEDTSAGPYAADIGQHTQHKLHQAKLRHGTEWIPVQVYGAQQPTIPCPGLQMYLGGLQGRAIASYFKVVWPKCTSACSI